MADDETLLDMVDDGSPVAGAALDDGVASPADVDDSDAEASPVALPAERSQGRTVSVPLPTALAALLIVGLIGGAIGYFATRSATSGEQVEATDRLKGPVVDTFSVATDAEGLNLTANGRPWSGNRADFKIDGGQLKLVDSAGPESRVAIVDTGAVHHLVAATFSKVRTGSGVVFRYKGPNNYWSLTAAQASGTWTLAKVVNGKRENPVLLGTAPTADGTQVMVRAEGNRLFFYFDGAQFNTLNDGDLSDGTKVGLILAGPNSKDVRVDDLAALPTRQRATPKPAAGASGSDGDATTTTKAP